MQVRSLLLNYEGLKDRKHDVDLTFYRIHIKVDLFQETTVKGVFASGDNATRIRTLANAVAMGTTVGMTISKTMILDEFQD